MLQPVGAQCPQLECGLLRQMGRILGGHPCGMRCLFRQQGNGLHVERDGVGGNTLLADGIGNLAHRIRTDATSCGVRFMNFENSRSSASGLERSRSWAGKLSESCGVS